MKLLTFSLQWFLIMTCTGIKVKEGTKWKLKRTLLEIQFIISKTTKRKKYVLKLTHEMRQFSCFPLQVCPPPLSCRSCLPWMLSSTVRAPRVFTWASDGNLTVQGSSRGSERASKDRSSIFSGYSLSNQGFTMGCVCHFKIPASGRGWDPSLYLEGWSCH